MKIKVSLSSGFCKMAVAGAGITLLLATGCSRSAEEKITTFPNKFADNELIKLYDYKDRRQSDALVPLLNHPNPTYREEAALAFASTQDSVGLPALENLLADRVPEVRKAAVFAIGQLKSNTVLAALALQLTQENEPVVRYHMLEAFGKCLSADYINYLASYEASDPLTQAGKAWGIYHAGLSGTADSLLTNAAGLLLADSMSHETRLAAANYFGRTRGISIAGWEHRLKEMVMHDVSPEVRMAAARGLAKATGDSIGWFINDALQAEESSLVKVNLVRSLKETHFTIVAETLADILRGNDYHLSVATAETLQQWTNREVFAFLWAMRNEVPVLRSRALILGKTLESQLYSYNAYRELVDGYERSASPYLKGLYLQALEGYPNASGYLAAQLGAPHPFVRTSAMEALNAMNQSPAFPSYKQRELAEYYKKAILSGDAGQVTVAATALSRLRDNLRPFYPSLDFLYQGLDSLQLPRDLEPYQAIETVIGQFQGGAPPESSQLYQNPIRWELVKEIKHNARAVVETSKGIFEIQLLVEDAPGTVENFVSLAGNNFYENLVFHRVVPNFVVQAGCPRGDGYGSSDEVIRSEFSTEKYGTGYVGMASAGKDTEGSQWFVTHSPTPHLNGSYTIFGKVVKGMDVVNSIEMGDRIISVEIQ